MSDDRRRYYREVEGDYWASAWGTKPDESAVLERHLSSQADTVEAGTGNGRILYMLLERGFTRLSGFDFAPELIDAARSRPEGGRIQWEVADARSLPYEDGRFEQAIYLSQIVSNFARPEDRAAVLREAARILRPGGLALFSFLPYEARRADWRYRPYLAYLRARRTLARSGRSEQELPRLRAGGRLSATALTDAGPHAYWHRLGEAEEALRSAGFAIEAIGSTPQVMDEQMAGSAAALRGELLAGTLYAVCRRPPG